MQSRGGKNRQPLKLETYHLYFLNLNSEKYIKSSCGLIFSKITFPPLNVVVQMTVSAPTV